MGKRILVIKLKSPLSLLKVPFEVKFANDLISNDYGEMLSTLTVKGLIHKYRPLDYQDKFFAFFFKYGPYLFYTLSALLIGIFGASHLNWYFNSLFESFVVLMVDVKLDPETIENLKNAF